MSKTEVEITDNQNKKPRGLVKKLKTDLFEREEERLTLQIRPHSHLASSLLYTLIWITRNEPFISINIPSKSATSKASEKESKKGKLKIVNS